MKIVIFGLGNFGMALAIHLANSGNEVVVADKDPQKIDMIKDKVAHAVTMDATNENSYRALPLQNTDIAIMAMSANEGMAIMSTAIVKKICKARIIARSSSNIQDTIFEAMGVDQIIHPEQEFAERLTKKINLRGSIDNFEIDEDYLVSEVDLCKSLIGKTIVNSNFREKYELNIITILRNKKHQGLLGRNKSKQIVTGMPRPNMKFEENDVLVVFGKNSSIDRYLKQLKS